ncbi:MAG: DUF1330 domain-containing protein [Pseudolabrys sp.]|nr:DUF1330 domain-containing protein [Pseudolabrys sp.]
MAKGYWVALVEVKNPDGYKNEYVAGLPTALKKFGGRYVTRGGQTQVPEGSSKSRVVVLEFPSYQAAVDCYNSPEYAPLKAARKAHAQADIIIVEGYDGAQP